MWCADLIQSTISLLATTTDWIIGTSLFRGKFLFLHKFFSERILMRTIYLYINILQTNILTISFPKNFSKLIIRNPLCSFCWRSFDMRKRKFNVIKEKYTSVTEINLSAIGKVTLFCIIQHTRRISANTNVW